MSLALVTQETARESSFCRWSKSTYAVSKSNPLPALQPGADLAGAFVVMLPGAVSTMAQAGSKLPVSSRR